MGWIFEWIFEWTAWTGRIFEWAGWMGHTMTEVMACGRGRS